MPPRWTGRHQPACAASWSCTRNEDALAPRRSGRDRSHRISSPPTARHGASRRAISRRCLDRLLLDATCRGHAKAIGYRAFMTPSGWDAECTLPNGCAPAGGGCACVIGIIYESRRTLRDARALFLTSGCLILRGGSEVPLQHGPSTARWLPPKAGGRRRRDPMVPRRTEMRGYCSEHEAVRTSSCPAGQEFARRVQADARVPCGHLEGCATSRHGPRLPWPGGHLNAKMRRTGSAALRRAIEVSARHHWLPLATRSLRPCELSGDGELCAPTAREPPRRGLAHGVP